MNNHMQVVVKMGDDCLWPFLTALFVRRFQIAGNVEQ